MRNKKINPNLLGDNEIFEIIKSEYYSIKPKDCRDFFRNSKKSPSLPYIEKRFNMTYNEVLIKAGIPEEELHFVRRDRQRLKEIINEVYMKLGHTPTAKEFQKYGCSVTPLVKCFGSFEDALIEAGLTLKSDKEIKLSSISPDMIIKEYRELCDSLGRLATSKDIDIYGKEYSLKIILIKFGSIRNLRKLAGYCEGRNRKSIYTKDIIVDILIAEYLKYNRRLTVREINGNKLLPSSNTILIYFKTKSWDDVWRCIEKAILQKYNHIKSIPSKNNSISDLKKIKSGKRGENAVIHQLSFLDANKYYVFSNIIINVNGNKQEIDQLVVGPNGIFNIETKNLSGKINIDNNGNWSRTWWDSYDATISPVAQIERHENILNQLFQEKFKIESIVLFSHPNCEISGKMNSPYTVLKIDNILSYINNYKQEFLYSSKEISKICRIIKRYSVQASEKSA